MQKKQRIRGRLAFDAMLVAIYVVLTFLVIPIGGLKITFEHFPVVLCAILYGPVDAMLVGGIGEFLNQVTSFGFTPTTLLWILPIVFRGLIMGCCAKMFQKQVGVEAILQKRVPTAFLLSAVITGICSSLLNTLALYVDSKMFGYYNYAMVFGALLLRVALGIATTVMIVICIKSVLHALRKSNLV